MRAFTQKDMQEIQSNFPFQDCLPLPAASLTPEMAAAFDQLVDRNTAGGFGQEIPYDLPYPKWLFLDYLASSRGWKLHGSQIGDLAVIRPIRNSRDSREFGDQPAIYATQDPLWALFFAVLKRDSLQGPIMNGAIHLQDSRGAVDRRYFFCVDAPTLRTFPWGPGAMYLLPGEGFEPDPDQEGLTLDEYRLLVTHWLHRGELQPVARLAVTPEDFPYLHQVWGYDPAELDKRFSAPSVAGWPFLTDESLYPIHP
jgi:hypothetical protein